MISIEGLKNYLVLNVPQLKEQISTIKSYNDLEKFLEEQLNKAVIEFNKAMDESKTNQKTTTTEQYMTPIIDKDSEKIITVYEDLKNGSVYRHASWPESWCIFMHCGKLVDQNCVSIQSFPTHLDPKGWVAIGAHNLANTLVAKSYRKTPVTKTSTEINKELIESKKYSTPEIENKQTGKEGFIKYGAENKQVEASTTDPGYLHHMYLAGYIGRDLAPGLSLKHKVSIAYALGKKSQAEKRNILSVTELNEIVESLLK